MQENDVSNELSAGFFVVRLFDCPAALRSGLLPKRVLTLSSCLTSLFPDTWTLDWSSETEDDRLAAAALIGIEAADLPTLLANMTTAFADGKWCWPHVWVSLDDARRAALEYQLSREEFAIVELGVRSATADELLVDLAAGPNEAECGLLTNLRRRRHVHSTGTLLGWEPLGIEQGGSMHSWLCNGLHRDAHERLGITPGKWGLIESATDATRVERLIQSGIGAEPVPWFCARLSIFDW